MRRSTKTIAKLGCLFPLFLCRAVFAQESGTAEEAALAPDDASLLGEEDPGRPPAKGKGVVWGVVTDEKTKEPVIDAQVSVVGTKFKAIADYDGRYRLELSPGTYELRVFYQLYKPQRLQNVRVTAGKVDKIDVALPAEEALKEQEIVVEVEADPDRASAAAQTLIRKNAVTVGDAISAQEIAKTPDRNAADAAKRVVGATVVGGRYVFVRGLGERYTNALLNGMPLPSPEPDRQAVPFDLFPTSVLSDLTILKTFTPDMPGDFAGGSVRVTTRELPEKLLIQGTFNIGFNTESTFQDRLTYRGSGTDWLGLDDGTRGLPSTIPGYKVTRLGAKPGGGTISNDELTTYGRAINAYMSTQRTLNAPNMSGNVTVGNTHKFGADHELGYLSALTYGRRFQSREDEIRREILPGVSANDDYRIDKGLDLVSWGGYGGLTYRYVKDHKVSLIGLYTRLSNNEAREKLGYSNTNATIVESTRLRFVSRVLALGQLAGEHKLRKLRDATLDWTFSLSSAALDDPDQRENIYNINEGGAREWSKQQNGQHVFADQSDTIYGGQLNWTQPLTKGDATTRLKAGAFFLARSRDFSLRRFRFLARNPPGFDYSKPPDELFLPENIGSGPSAPLELEETTTSDSYTADQSVVAGYVMGDASLTSWLRLVLGARVEAWALEMPVFSEFDPGARSTTTRSQLDLLPAVNLIFKTTSKSNLRLAVSRTVARPQLRELAPVIYRQYDSERDSERNSTGNPELDRANILNMDLRFELFPTLAEVAAISVFYKDFTKPIEPIIKGDGGPGLETFKNAKGARAAGIELELRKNLGFATPVLADFGVLANLTLVRSRVEINEEDQGILTNRVRPLAGQSPYVLNAGVDYSNDKSGTRFRVLYNLYGPRLDAVGTEASPDEYEQPRHLLDLTVAQRVSKYVDLKLAAENLLFTPVTYTEGPDLEENDANVVKQYKPGASFTLSATVQTP